MEVNQVRFYANMIWLVRWICSDSLGGVRSILPDHGKPRKSQVFGFLWSVIRLWRNDIRVEHGDDMLRNLLPVPPGNYGVFE